MKPGRFVALILFAATAVMAGAWRLQRDAAAALRLEADGLREENRELATLRAENQRLTAGLPPAADIARLRADRAAVERLRNEIEKLKDDVQRRERALAPIAR